MAIDDKKNRADYLEHYYDPEAVKKKAEFKLMFISLDGDDHMTFTRDQLEALKNEKARLPIFENKGAKKRLENGR